MNEPRSAPSQEPGHRYHPRQAAPRMFSDVHRPIKAAPRQYPDARHTQASQLTQQHPIVPAAPAQHSAASQLDSHAPVAQQHVPLHTNAPQPRAQLPMQVMSPDITAQYQKVPLLAPAPKPPVKQRSVAATKPAAPRQHRSLVLHRRIADKAASHKKQAKQQRIKAVYAFGLGGLAALVFMSGVLVLTGRLTNRTGNSPAIANQGSEVARTLGARTDRSTAVSVTEDPVSAGAIDNYDVRADEPRILLIPRLSVQSRVLQVDPGYNGEPLQTDSLFDFGWLSDSALPGANGVTVLSGYTNGPTKAGPLANIGDLKVGDDITVERGDGKTYTYKVIRSQAYDANKVDMAAVRNPAIAGTPGLNLLTYTGRFNVRTNQYEQRTVIFAAMQ